MKRVQVMIFLVFWGLSIAPDAQADDPSASFIESAKGQLRLLADDWVSVPSWKHLHAERYWIVRVEPLKIGSYTVIHDCRNVTKYGGYERYKRTYSFSVAPAGTSRTHIVANLYWGSGRHTSTQPEACLGDAVVLVFNLSPHYDNHGWAVTSDSPIRKDRIEYLRPPHSGMHDVVNPASSCLRMTEVVQYEEVFQKRGAGKVIRRPFIDVSFDAIAQAKLSFRFPFFESSGMTIPMAIVPKEKALNVFINNAFDREYNPGGGASSGSKQLDVEAYVLRVGDSIHLKLSGVHDEFHPVQYEVLPFTPNTTLIHKRVKWKDY